MNPVAALAAAERVVPPVGYPKGLGRNLAAVVDRPVGHSQAAVPVVEAVAQTAAVDSQHRVAQRRRW